MFKDFKFAALEYLNCIKATMGWGHGNAQPSRKSGEVKEKWPQKN
jgi:hypothetical protein